MKALKIILSLAATITIFLSVDYLKPNEVGLSSLSDYLFPSLLVISFVYLHLTISQYLIPVNSLSNIEEQTLKNVSRSHYNSSFFHGAQGLGYILLFTTILPLFEPTIIEMRNITDPGKNILLAFLLVLAGVAAKARGIFLFLVSQYQGKVSIRSHNENT